MNIDNTEIKIFNIDNNLNLFNINAKQYDTTGARGIVFRLIKNNMNMDLTDIIVNVGGRKSDGTDIFNSCEIIDSKKGLIQINLTTQMLTIAGILKLELILMKDSIRLSSYPFDINVAPSITNFQAIQSSDEFGVLTEALNKVNNSLMDTENKVNGAVNELKANLIGSTNLLTGTQWFDAGWNKGVNANPWIGRNDLFEGCAVQMQNYDWSYFSQTVNYEIGQVYTISCYARTDCTEASVGLFFSVSDDKTAWGKQMLTKEWKKYSLTFTADQPKGDLRMETNCSNWGNGKAYISKMKLEKGTVPTDWSPNPLDYKYQIGNGENLLGKCLVTTDRVAFDVTNLEKGKFYTLDMGDIVFNGSYAGIYDYDVDYIGASGNQTQTIHNFEDGTKRISDQITFQITGNIDKTKKYRFVFWGGGIADVFKNSNKRIKLENGFVATGFTAPKEDEFESLGVTNLLSNSGQLIDTGNWWLNKAENTNASIGLDTGYNGTTHGLKAICDNAGDWCILQSGALKNNDFYFTEGEYYTLSGLVWVNDPNKYKSIPIAIGDGNGQNQIFGDNIIFNTSNIEYGDSHYSKFQFTFKANIKGNENQLKVTLNTGIQLYLAYVKLERGKVATDWNYSIYDIKSYINDISTNTKQIISNSSAISDIQHNWFSDCSNSLNLSGLSNVKVYPEGVYFITGSDVVELHQLDHSAIKDGQKIYFIAETCDQTACIKFCKDALAKCGVYTPKGQDFWITGRDNGDTIYIMQKIGGAMRFRSL